MDTGLYRTGASDREMARFCISIILFAVKLLVSVVSSILVCLALPPKFGFPLMIFLALCTVVIVVTKIVSVFRRIRAERFR